MLDRCHTVEPECSSCVLKSRKNAKSWKNSSRDAQDASCSHSLVAPNSLAAGVFYPVQSPWANREQMLVCESGWASDVSCVCWLCKGNSVTPILTFQFRVSPCFRPLFVALCGLPSSLWTLGYNSLNFCWLAVLRLAASLPWALCLCQGDPSEALQGGFSLLPSQHTNPSHWPGDSVNTPLADLCTVELWAVFTDGSAQVTRLWHLWPQRTGEVPEDKRKRLAWRKEVFHFGSSRLAW